MGRSKKEVDPDIEGPDEGPESGSKGKLLDIDDIEFTDEETKLLAQYFKIRNLDESSKIPKQEPKPQETKPPDWDKDTTKPPNWDTDTTEHAKDVIDSNKSRISDFLRKDQGRGFYHTVFVIEEDFTISETRMRFKDSRLNTKHHDYIVTNPPYKQYKFFKLGYDIVYYVSTKTGTTIDFAKIYSGIAQVDSKTMDDYFDKRAMRNMLGLYTRDFGDVLLGLVAGAGIGAVLGMML